MTGKELLTNMLGMNLREDVIVRCYTQGREVLLKVVDVAQPGFGEPDEHKIVLTGTW